MLQEKARWLYTIYHEQDGDYSKRVPFKDAEGAQLIFPIEGAAWRDPALLVKKAKCVKREPVPPAAKKAKTAKAAKKNVKGDAHESDESSDDESSDDESSDDDNVPFSKVCPLPP